MNESDELSRILAEITPERLTDVLEAVNATLPLFRSVRTPVKPCASRRARNPAIGTRLPLPTLTPLSSTTNCGTAGTCRSRRAGGR